MKYSDGYNEKIKIYQPIIINDYVMLFVKPSGKSHMGKEEGNNIFGKSKTPLREPEKDPEEITHNLWRHLP